MACILSAPLTSDTLRFGKDSAHLVSNFECTDGTTTFTAFPDLTWTATGNEPVRIAELSGRVTDGVTEYPTPLVQGVLIRIRP